MRQRNSHNLWLAVSRVSRADLSSPSPGRHWRGIISRAMFRCRHRRHRQNAIRSSRSSKVGSRLLRRLCTSVELVWDATADIGLAIYDAKSGVLRVNGFHPFVASFFSEFESKSSGLPLKLFAMAEVLLEAQLFQQGYKQADVDAIMGARDRYLRDVADSSGRRTALTISRALHEARNNESKLEDEVVAAFDSLGFDAAKDATKRESRRHCKSPSFSGCERDGKAVFRYH